MFPSCKWELNCIFLLHLQDGWLHGDTDQNLAGRTRGLWNTFGWRHLERRSPRTAWVFLLAMAPSTFFFRTFPEHVFMRSVFFDYPFLFQLVCYWFLWTKIVLVRNIFCWWFRNPINQFEVGSSSYSWRVLGTHPRPVVGLGLGISSSICPTYLPGEPGIEISRFLSPKRWRTPPWGTAVGATTHTFQAGFLTWNLFSVGKCQKSLI